MFQFGAASLGHLEECAAPLQMVANTAIRCSPIDFAIIEGFRPRAEQMLAFELGRSKVKWPMSKHNVTPSMAFDAAPYPVIWPDKDKSPQLYDKALGRFYLMAGVILCTAKDLKIDVRWGGDWDMDGDVFDQNFDDLVHFELTSGVNV